jgi:F0F1-type ATP synthase delta subunit
MAQAAQDERDAELGLRTARNGVQDARLNLALAKRDLREFLKVAGVAKGSLDSLFKRATDVSTSPAQAAQPDRRHQRQCKGKIDPLDLRQKIQAVRDAQLGVAGATNQVTHAETNLSDARKKQIDFTRRGLDAYKPYVTALHAVEQANKRVARAEDQTSAAHRKYAQALKALTPQEKGFLGTLDTFLKRFTDLAKVVSAPIFKGLGDAMQSLQRVFSDRSVQSGLEGIGQAIGDFFRTLGTQLSTDRWRTAFAQFAQGAASMIGSAGRAFRAVLEIFRVIAQTALPTLLSIAHRAAGALENVASKPGRIRSVINGLISSFRVWASVAGHLAGIVLGFLRGAKGTGDSLAGTIRRLLTHWDRWINSKDGQAAVQRFLRRSVSHVRNLIQDLPKVLEAFKHIADVVNGIAKAVKFVAENPIGGGANASGGGREARSDVEGPFKAATNPQNSTSSRINTALSLLELQISQDMRKALVKMLRQLGFTYKDALKRGYSGPKFARGGLVPGSGFGDTVPALLEPGEFVVRRAIVRQLSLPVLRALNGGAVPALATAGAGAPRVTHNHFNIPAPLDATKPIDPENTAALLQAAWEARGGGVG